MPVRKRAGLGDGFAAGAGRVVGVEVRAADSAWGWVPRSLARMRSRAVLMIVSSGAAQREGGEVLARQRGRSAAGVEVFEGGALGDVEHAAAVGGHHLAGAGGLQRGSDLVADHRGGDVRGA